MITEDYVSYEIAKLLKEKGFDEPCRSAYIWNTEEYELCAMFSKPLNFNREGSLEDYEDDSVPRISAPTHQMAMKWLREIYDIFIDIGYDDLDWYWLIESISKDIPYADRPKLIKNGTACHKTYEEATEAALKYCLENLI